MTSPLLMGISIVPGGSKLIFEPTGSLILKLTVTTLGVLESIFSPSVGCLSLARRVAGPSGGQSGSRRTVSVVLASDPQLSLFQSLDSARASGMALALAERRPPGSA